MNLNSVNLFVAVVHAGSFSAASRKTGIPVATVSRHVSELEKELKIRLMERSTRRLRLTDAGQLFFEYADRGLDELNQARRALDNREKELRGSLRLSLPPNFTPWWSLIRRFQSRFPYINVKVLITERKTDLIEDGIDVALRVGDVKHLSTIGRKLGNYHHMIVASPEYILKYGEPEHPSQLVDLPVAAWRIQSDFNYWLLADTQYGIDPFLEVNDYAHLEHLVLDGECITELPPFLAKRHLEDGKLVEILKAYPFPEYELNLLYPSRQQLSRIVRAYVDFCLQEVTL